MSCNLNPLPQLVIVLKPKEKEGNSFTKEEITEWQRTFFKILPTQIQDFDPKLGRFWTSPADLEHWQTKSYREFQSIIKDLNDPHKTVDPSRICNFRDNMKRLTSSLWRY